MGSHLHPALTPTCLAHVYKVFWGCTQATVAALECTALVGLHKQNLSAVIVRSIRVQVIIMRDRIQYAWARYQLGNSKGIVAWLNPASGWLQMDATSFYFDQNVACRNQPFIPFLKDSCNDCQHPHALSELPYWVKSFSHIIFVPVYPA